MAEVISVNGKPVIQIRWYDEYNDPSRLLSVAGKLRDSRRTVSTAASKLAAAKRRNIRARGRK